MRILTFDIETAPRLANVWGIWQQNIPLNMLLEDGYMLSWSAKWLDSGEVLSDSLANYGNRIEEEANLAATLYDLIEEADVIVTYNGDAFDKKVANTAFLLGGMTPPTRSKSIDLFKVVKNNFKFTSNKLDFVLKKLGLTEKIQTGGFELWRDCMEGDPDSWERMVEYNKQDVIATEALYRKLLPWIRNHPSYALYDDEVSDPVCNNCGSTHIKKNGVERLKFTTYQRYRCTDCGTNMRGKTLLNTSDKRKSILANV